MLVYYNQLHDLGFTLSLCEVTFKDENFYNEFSHTITKTAVGR